MTDCRRAAFMTEIERDRPGVVAPPPLIYIGFLLAGLVLDYLMPATVVSEDLRYPLGLALVGLGLLVFVPSVWHFRKAGTNLQTRQPTTAIVTAGPFRFSRNPIYLALALIYAGIGVAANALWAVLLLVPLMLVIRYGVVAREERYLEHKFGEAYRRYKASVRRWI